MINNIILRPAVCASWRLRRCHMWDHMFLLNPSPLSASTTSVACDDVFHPQPLFPFATNNHVYFLCTPSHLSYFFWRSINYSSILDESSFSLCAHSQTAGLILLPLYFLCIPTFTSSSSVYILCVLCTWTVILLIYADGLNSTDKNSLAPL